MVDFVSFRTFDSFNVFDDNHPGGVDFHANLVNLANAIQVTASAGIPLVGLGKRYTFSKPALSTESIPLFDNCNVICLPGCQLVRPHAFDSGNVGFISGGTSLTPLRNARWRGAHLIGLDENGDDPGTDPDYTGPYPPGQVFRVACDDLWVEDLVIDGYGAPDEIVGGKRVAHGGPAMALFGDRVRVWRPRILHPYKPNGAGIRFYGGTNFRCYGGSVDAGGDAALQFSTGRFNQGGFANTDIVDGAYIDTVCTSHDGRLLLVGTSDAAIRHVAFVRVSGRTTGDGECVRIENNDGDGSDLGGVIEGVLLDQVAVAHESTEAFGIVVRNMFGDADKLVSDIRLRQVTVTSPSDTALLIYADVASAADNPLGPIRNFSWVGGGVNSPSLATKSPTLGVERLTNGVFAALRIAGGTSDRPSLVLGAASGALGVALARNVVLADVAVNGVNDEEIAVRFDHAENCRVARGVVTQAAGADATAFRASADARRCAVAGADVAEVTSAFAVDPSAEFRIGANYTGSRPENGRRLPFSLGTAGATVASASVVVASSRVALSTPTGPATPPVDLSTVTGGIAGDILVLSWTGAAGTTPVRVVDDADNLRLAANAPLDAAADTLTLIRRGGAQWLEVARSNNG